MARTRAWIAGCALGLLAACLGCDHVIGLADVPPAADAGSPRCTFAGGDASAPPFDRCVFAP